MGWEDPDSNPLADVRHWCDLFQNRDKERKTMDDKYMVYKRAEMQAFLSDLHGSGRAVMPQHLDDAVVIRRQDLFAPPALDAYANAISIARELVPDGDVKDRLRDIADYFSDQAAKAWCTDHRKLPD